MRTKLFITTALVLATVVSPTSIASGNDSVAPQGLGDETQISAKQMEQMYEKSQLLFIGKFKKHELLKLRAGDKKLIGCYEYLDVLKGPWLGSPPRLYLKFLPAQNDSRSKASTKNLAFPEKNSKWIIFVPKLEPVEGPWAPLKDGNGILKYSDNRLKTLKEAIANYKFRHMYGSRLKFKDGSSYEFAVPVVEFNDSDLFSQDPKFKTDLALFKKRYHKSESILIAKYESYVPPKGTSRNNAPIGLFKRIEYLKGKVLKGDPFVRIRYSFKNSKVSDKKNQQQSDSSTLPKESKWILFIPKSQPVDGAYDTLKAPVGMVPFNGWTFELTMRTIEMIKGCQGGH